MFLFRMSPMANSARRLRTAAQRKLLRKGGRVRDAITWRGVITVPPAAGLQRDGAAPRHGEYSTPLPGPGWIFAEPPTRCRSMTITTENSADPRLHFLAS